jgi:peptidoglycan hydrolase-like protein with peptidoglycan-binding domain
MARRLLPTLLFVVATLPGLAGADELTAIIQQDLSTLGYDPGNLDGEATVQTVVAVSKFQAEHDMEVTGEITPQLAGIIKAAISQQGQGQRAQGQQDQAEPASAASPATPAPDPAALQAAQQACLQQKVADAQEAQRKKRGIGSLMRAVSRTASRIGSNDTARAVANASSDIYTAGAVASDLESAAKDLGLTESDVEACRNPQ